MSQDCFKNIQNIANQYNSFDLPNSLTCRFTWFYLESTNELCTYDQSTVPSGDSISLITVTIKDGTNQVQLSGGAGAAIVLDVSTLDNTVDWRIEYEVESTNGLNCAGFLFIAPYVPELITASSDPSYLPIPASTFFPSTMAHPVQVYEQSFVNQLTWSVTHNTGFADPLSIQTYNAAGNIIMVGRSNITANSFDIVFLSPTTGSVKVISKV